MPAASLSTPIAPAARDRLLDTATVLFATHGYHAIGLRDLAARLGMHAGSLYYHIENKQGLLFELIESTLADLLLATERRVNGGKGYSERLECFIQAFVAFSLSDHDRLVLLTRDVVYLNAEQNAQIGRLKDTYTALLGSIISTGLGQPRGASQLQVRLLANAIAAMLFGQSQWLTPEVSATQLSNCLTAFVLGSIAALSTDAAQHGSARNRAADTTPGRTQGRCAQVASGQKALRTSGLD